MLRGVPQDGRANVQVAACRAHISDQRRRLIKHHYLVGREERGSEYASVRAPLVIMPVMRTWKAFGYDGKQPTAVALDAAS
jgi:hypothetical protein